MLIDPSVFFFIVQYPVSLRLNRQFSEALSNPDARDTDVLRREVEDNVSAYICVASLKKRNRFSHMNHHARLLMSVVFSRTAQWRVHADPRRTASAEDSVQVWLISIGVAVPCGQMFLKYWMSLRFWRVSECTIFSFPSGHKEILERGTVTTIEQVMMKYLSCFPNDEL